MTGHRRILLICFLQSFGSGFVGKGVYFFAKERHDSSDTQNLCLAGGKLASAWGSVALGNAATIGTVFALCTAGATWSILRKRA